MGGRCFRYFSVDDTTEAARCTRGGGCKSLSGNGSLRGMTSPDYRSLMTSLKLKAQHLLTPAQTAASGCDSAGEI